MFNDIPTITPALLKSLCAEADPLIPDAAQCNLALRIAHLERVKAVLLLMTEHRRPDLMSHPYLARVAGAMRATISTCQNEVADFLTIHDRWERLVSLFIEWLEDMAPYKEIRLPK